MQTIQRAPVQQEPRIEYPLFWCLGSGLVSQVPCLGDALGVVGIEKLAEGTERHPNNFDLVGKFVIQ